MYTMNLDAWLDPERWKKFLQTPITRRRFLQGTGMAAALLLLTGKLTRKVLAQSGTTLASRKRRVVKTDCPLAVVEGNDPAEAARRAVAALGGIQRFVRRGDVVVVKPNIGWDRNPEQAANTNPEVVGALVSLCKDAGARTVKVFDNTCNDPRRTYENSGIQAAVRKAGGQIYFVNDWKFYPGNFPAGSLMADWPLFRDAVECDCFINVPIAKHHRLAGLTLSMKNLMGICGNSRGQIHQSIHEKLVELTAFMQPDLTVVDAYRILLRNGPTGGNLGDVALKKHVLASADPVLADAYATTLFGMPADHIEHVRLAAQKGLGSLDVNQPGIRKITL
jgi:uncharacterized protein (DUF362 family)